MTKIISSLLILFVTTVTAQIPSYYNGLDLSLDGMDLKNTLTTRISNTHTNQISYTPGVWNVLKQSDLDPTNSNKVLLVYGYDDTDASLTNDRTRDKNSNGGGSSDWNREHVFPRSLGTPNLGSSGPGSDAHNLRSSDVGFNGQRGNKKFATGSGNAGSIGSNWYPGNEWKGDVARIYMYMYVRYTTRCKPGNACIGNAIPIDLNMVDVLLQWNIEDPVSDFERDRNNEIYDAQGNRNPFIDNAYLATLIWGGNDAENTWLELGIEEDSEKKVTFSVYPNPSINGIIHIKLNTINTVSRIDIYDISGKLINEIQTTDLLSTTVIVDNLRTGIYFLKVSTMNAILTKKIVIK